MHAIDKRSSELESQVAICTVNDYDKLFKNVELTIRMLESAISQKLSSVSERLIITRESNNDFDLESFNCDSRGVHPCNFQTE